MKTLTLPLVVIVALTILYLAAVACDWTPYLRGTEDWRWSLMEWPPVWRLLPLLIAGAAYLLLVLRWERAADRISARHLATMVLVALALQFAALFVRYPHPLRFIYNLAASDSINGYHTVAAGVEDIGEFLRAYPGLMPNLPNHLTTHPPGLILLFWATGRLVAFVPSLAQALARGFLTLGCMHPWVQSASQTGLAGGLFAYLIPLLGAMTTIPIYGLGKRLYGPQVGWRAALLWPLVPAFAMNAGQADQMYPFFTTTALYLFDLGIRRRRPWPTFFAGLMLSWATFLSLGLLAAAALPAFYTLFLLIRGSVRADAGWWGRMGFFTLGLISVWLLYGATCRINPLQLWQSGLGTHMGLDRPYDRWVLFNLVDFLPFAGIVIVLMLPLGLARLLRQPAEAWGPASLLTLLTLDLSGATRGEVSRLWLFMVPPLILTAMASLRAWEENLTHVSRARPAWALWSAGALLLVQLTVFAARVADPHPRFYEMLTPPREVPHLQYPVEASFGDLIRLAGYDLSTDQAAPGEEIKLTLYWQTLSSPPRAYKVFTHLYDEGASLLIGQEDKMPLSGDWPTTCWTAGEVYWEEFGIRVAADAPEGEYLLQTGFYDPLSGERLPSQQQGRPPDTRVVLTTITVRP